MSNSFGKPEWFREKRVGCGVCPNSWQGWLYLGVAAAIMAVPAIGFVMFSRVPEAIVWTIAAAAMVTWDLKGVKRAIQAEKDKDLFIIDENETGSEIATRNFDMQLRE